MAEVNFPPNSHKYKEAQEKKVTKVISGEAKIQKKPEARKFVDALVSEDAANVKDYIFMDVLIPYIKDALANIIKGSVDMILYGESGRNNTRQGRSDKVSYRQYYDQGDRFIRGDNRRERVRERFSYDTISVPSRGEAERVLTCLSDLIDEYGQATVADLYDLVGITCENTDFNYGWMNLRNASIYRSRDGYYMFSMPKAVPIRK